MLAAHSRRLAHAIHPAVNDERTNDHERQVYTLLYDKQAEAYHHMRRQEHLQILQYLAPVLLCGVLATIGARSLGQLIYVLLLPQIQLGNRLLQRLTNCTTLTLLPVVEPEIYVGVIFVVLFCGLYCVRLKWLLAPDPSTTVVTASRSEGPRHERTRKKHHHRRDRSASPGRQRAQRATRKRRPTD
jgi:hypothetical protein